MVSGRYESPRESVSAGEVFGVQRGLPRNYVQRPEVDGRFVEALKHKQHIVIYGSSKQGKTSLRKWTLNERPKALISCINMTSVTQLHLSILKEAGYRIEQSTSSAGENSRVKLSVGADWPGGIKPSVEWENVLTDQEQIASHSLELDPSDFNEVIAALNQVGFNNLVVLEDYHYLDGATQAEFARLLKAYYDYSDLCFIVIGVWLDEHRLVRYAGDLRERITPISVDSWSQSQLEQVIERGQDLLGIQFTSEFKSYLLQHCFDSVWVVQRVCGRACAESGITGEQDQHRTIGSIDLAKRLVREVIDSQTARSEAFIEGFTLGPVYESRTIFSWITFALLASDPEYLERGLGLDEMKQFTEKYYYDGYIDIVTLRMSLEQVTWFQMTVVKISPIVVDYDKTARRLHVVDREFLIWLSGQKRSELLRNAGMPIKSLTAWLQDTNQPSRHHSNPS
jgi:hypothetical protein